MARELAAAYITIIPSLQGASESIKNQLAGVDTSAIGTQMGNSIGQNMTKGVANATKFLVASIGAIGGAMGSMAATGGMARALNIEQAQTMFKGLKLEWNDYEKTITDAVTGTAFGMDQASLVAASLAAAGVSAGEQMERALNACVGTAATFGTDLGDIGDIFQKVAAKSKLSGDELMSLNARGINAISILSEQLGKTQEEVQKMVSAGKIDFQTFSDAMYAAFGDSAQAANETFTGSMANMRSALSRIGAKFATPFKDACIPVFNAVREALNAVSARLDPLVEKFSEFAGFVSSVVVEKFTAFTDALNNGESFLGALQAALGNVGGVIGLVASGVIGLGSAFGALSVVFSAIPGLSAFSTILGSMAGGGGAFAVSRVAIGALQKGFSVLSSSINAAGGGIRGFGAVLVSALTNPLTIVIGVVAALAAAFVYLWKTNEGFRNTVSALGAELASVLQPAISTVGSALKNMAQSVLPAVANLISALAPILESIVAVVVEIATAVIPVLVSVLEVLIPIIAEIVNAIVNAVTVLLQFVKPAVENIVLFIQQAITVIKEVVTTVMNAIQIVITTVLAIIQGDWNTAWQGICDFANIVWGAIRTVVENAINAISSVISSVLGAISSIWNSMWQSVCSFVASIWSQICEAVSSGIDSLMGLISGIPDAILGFFSDVGTWLIDAGRSLIQGFIDGIVSMAKPITDAVDGLLGGISGFFPHSPAKKGPFSGKGWVLYSGMSIVDALSEGMKLRTSDAMKTIGGVVGDIHDTFDSSLVDVGAISQVNSYQFDNGNRLEPSQVNQNFYVTTDDPNKAAAVVAARQREIWR